MNATLLQGWSGLCQGCGVVPGLGSLVVLCGWSIGQLPGVTSNHNHIPCLVLSCATTVWFLVVCGMLLSMLHAEGDMVGVLGDALELMEQPVYHFHRS